MQLNVFDNLRSSVLVVAAIAAGGVATAQSTVAPGAIYTMTNATDGNAIAIFDRGLDGAASYVGLVPTGGTGTGAGLGNQGGVILAQSDRFLLTVNAGSDTISVFRVDEYGLALTSVTPSGGDLPVSLTQHDGLVYALNAGSDSIAGFRLTFDGSLVPIPGSVTGLSALDAAAAQIGFAPDGDFLYVTHRANNLIDRFAVGPQGLARRVVPMTSNGATPFGFAFGQRDQLFVSEAAGGADSASTVSTYRLGEFGQLQTVTGSAPTTQTAACWVVASPDGRTIYTSNTGSDSISSFRVGFEGELRLLDPQAANTAAGPLDMALTLDGKFFYVIDAAAGVLGDYVVNDDASLTGIPGGSPVLPASVSGLAVR
ncbi:lactonase family protein [Engelhardtia mirabilis]|uniref:6-phosphogluconolactonase n=1 Tax=Engelhardtia mirabilis TaxID=2528011 RepID=A0A518BPQ4_9BACT|nr:6-phosphogluconolactonase [Planctomycetes bacterium Pla133]QDV03240.1 6-phosphogluconolactonase [Planctomycetes bacterium Pla86]